VTRIRLTRLLIAAGLATSITAGPLAPAAPAEGAAATTSFSATKTVTRSILAADGSSNLVQSRTVTLKVSNTSDLRGRQDINVSWSGAMSTGGIQPDLNGVLASHQEYPMVLLECRGKDSTSVPVAQRVDPRTCWTHGSDARYQGIPFTAFAPWRLDRYATTPDRAAVVGRPAQVPDACPDAAASEHWLPFVATDGRSYDYGKQSCAGLPPEDFNLDTSSQVVPPNATFAPTGIDGSGSAKFDVWTEAENASLGCTAAVACTLEAIPIMGISCDPNGVSPVAKELPLDDIPGPDDIGLATSLCETTGTYDPGELVSQSKSPAVAVGGQLWWSPSNWRNRIAVPLSFAPVSNACEQVGGGAPVAVFGSEVMTEATGQWAPSFCLDPKLFKFTHVQTAEPLARTLLNDPTSGVHAAFGSQSPPGGFARPTVQAPVAVSGFSISYNIDDVAGAAIGNLRLTPRLLAKLLTQSYPADDFDRFKTGQFPYLKSNPVNVAADPEFKALNPRIPSWVGLPGPATLIALSAESDVTAAVTSYINADPEARAWLDGKPDPWGMVVNPVYKKIALPVLRWPLLDTTLPDFGEQVPCSHTDAAPWLPLVASPTPTLATTSLDVQFAASPGKTGCTSLGDANNVLYQWASLGRTQPGQRFVIGITSLGEAARYDLQSAALQTQSSVDPAAKFTDGSGRTFVAPSEKSLAAAASHLKADPTTTVWSASASALQGDSGAYPGIMVVNADVPTTGLTAPIAKDYANLLRFAAGAGQHPGSGNGQLPPGYVPMTSGNGLGALADYTRRAAAAVQAQQGVVPPLVASGPSGSGLPPGAPGVAGGGAGGRNGGGVGGPAGQPIKSGAGGAAATKASAPSQSSSQVALTVKTPSTGFGVGGLVLPAILGFGLLGGLLAGGVLIRPRRRAQ
jgi:hypothetical protein